MRNGCTGIFLLRCCRDATSFIQISKNFWSRQFFRQTNCLSSNKSDDASLQNLHSWTSLLVPASKIIWKQSATKIFTRTNFSPTRLVVKTFGTQSYWTLTVSASLSFTRLCIRKLALLYLPYLTFKSPGQIYLSWLVLILGWTNFELQTSQAALSVKKPREMFFLLK